MFEKHINNVKLKGNFIQQFGNHKDFTFYKYNDGKKEIKFLRFLRGFDDNQCVAIGLS